MILTWLDWLAFWLETWLARRYARRIARRLALRYAQRNTLRVRFTIDDQATPALDRLTKALADARFQTVDPRTTLPSQTQTEFRINIVTDPPPETVTLEVGGAHE